MKFISYLPLAICCAVGSMQFMEAAELPSDISQKSKPATLKILIGRQLENALVEVRGRYQIYNPADGLPITSGIMDKRAELTATEGGLKWGDLLPGIFQLRIVPGDSQSTILVNGIQHRGCVEIYNIENGLNIVNEIDIEHYLKSILTFQFPQPLHHEVMDAVAILARTNAYYLAMRNPNVFWHIDAKETGYQGYALIFQNLHVDRAVESTRHMVLTYHNAPFAATWTKDSAGKTAEFAAIFRKEARAPSGVQAPLAEKDRNKHHWSFTVTKQQLAKITPSSGLTGIDLYLEKNSNKVYAVRLNTQAGSHDVDFFRLQKALGANRLLSNDFTVSLKGDAVNFSGYGEGHGVGLCLYSAELMAQGGDNASKILSSFFPDTKLEHLRAFSLEVTDVDVKEKL